MNKIESEIRDASQWIVKGFQSENLLLDFSLFSLKVVDEFIDSNSENGKAKEGSILSRNRGQILFALGCYLGETIEKNVPGIKWQINEIDPQSHINATLIFPNGTKLHPIQRCLNRFMNGAEESIYSYGLVAITELNNDNYWTKENLKDTNVQKKPWWKF